MATPSDSQTGKIQESHSVPPILTIFPTQRLLNDFSLLRERKRRNSLCRTTKLLPNQRHPDMGSLFPILSFSKRHSTPAPYSPTLSRSPHQNGAKVRLSLRALHALEVAWMLAGPTLKPQPRCQALLPEVSLSSFPVICVS